MSTIEVVTDGRDALYTAAFTAVNAPNVFHKVNARMVEPFQPASDYPLGQPPSRYPDILTIPPFSREELASEQAIRQRLAEEAATINRVPIFPVAHDHMAVMGQRPPRTLPNMGLSQEEIQMRARMPERQKRPMNFY